MSKSLSSSLALAAVVAVAVSGAAKADPAAGQLVFKQQCAVCHSVKPNQTLAAPTLYKVVGRKAGTQAGYPFSAAMKTSGITWTKAELDVYLTKPRNKVPKTLMAFAGLPDAKKRADLIDYLATLK